MMKNVLILILFPMILSAQQSLDGNTFLAKELSGFNNQEYSKGVAENTKFPIIEKIDIRTETHEFIEEEQEYLLRVSPATFGVRKAQKDLYQAINHQPDLITQDHVCDLSYDIQKDWLELWYLTSIQSINKNRLEFYKELEGLYEERIFRYKVSDIIKIKDQQNEIREKIMESEHQINNLLSFYNIESFQLDFSNKTALTDLVGQINEDTLNIHRLSIEELNNEIQINELELALEKAENRKILDFIQLRYNGPHSDPYTEKLSLGIGITIPNSGNKKLRIKELEYEAIQLEKEKELAQLEDQRENKKLLSSINSDLELYRKKKENSQNEKLMLEKYRKELLNPDDFDSEVYQFIEEKLFDLENELLKVENALNEKILRYFKQSDILCHKSNTQLLFNN